MKEGGKRCSFHPEEEKAQSSEGDSSDFEWLKGSYKEDGSVFTKHHKERRSAAQVAQEEVPSPCNQDIFYSENDHINPCRGVLEPHH